MGDEAVRDWELLDQEFDLWRRDGRRISFWWRDDDASAVTPELLRLLDLRETHDVPLGLAVVPATLKPALAEELDRLSSGVQVLQHGFAHRNYARENEKKSEFGEHRPMNEMRKEIASGTMRLRSLLNRHFFPLFVPPWNRISASLLPALSEQGFRGISTFGPRATLEPVKGLRQINTHVDLIDWRHGRGFKGSGRVIKEIVAHLRSRRVERATEPTGVLSHHLAHDRDTWEFLDTLFDFTRARSEVSWLTPAEALKSE